MTVNFKDIHILIVDNEAQMRTLIKSLLKTEGCKCANANNGQDALRVLGTKKFDIIISKWEMPYMTGFELLKSIRANPSLYKLPFIMYSIEESTSKILNAMEENVDSYLIAPFTGDKLIGDIERIYKARHNPPQIKKRVDEMRYHRIKKNYKEVLKAGANISEDEFDAEFYYLIAESLFVIHEYDKAVKIIDLILSRTQNSKAFHLAGKIAFQKGKSQEAVSFFQKATALSSFDDSKKIDLILAYYSLHLKTEAETLINEIVEAGPSEIITVQIANIYLDQNLIEKAGECLDLIQTPVHDSIYVFNKYATMLAKLEKYDECFVQFEKCLKNAPNSHDLYLNQGFVYSKIENYFDAKESLERALSLKPNSASAKVLLQFVQGKMNASEKKTNNQKLI